MRLETRMVEKVWGREALPTPFDGLRGRRIGEIWFEPPAQLDSLLVKYIFTSERLSIQVHPGGEAGKEECWLVTDAEPGARIGIGLTHELNAEELRAAALDGSLEHLLDWRPVKAGDFFSIPPGTIHAIGGGLGLVEIQQNRDVTYRLYDYGRPRALHLDDAVAVARAAPYDAALHCVARRGTLLEGGPFRVDLLDGEPDAALCEAFDGPLLLVPLAEGVSLAGTPIAPGECALAQRLGDVTVREGAQCLLVKPND